MITATMLHLITRTRSGGRVEYCFPSELWDHIKEFMLDKEIDVCIPENGPFKPDYSNARLFGVDGDIIAPCTESIDSNTFYHSSNFPTNPCTIRHLVGRAKRQPDGSTKIHVYGNKLLSSTYKRQIGRTYHYDLLYEIDKSTIIGTVHIPEKDRVWLQPFCGTTFTNGETYIEYNYSRLINRG